MVLILLLIFCLCLFTFEETELWAVSSMLLLPVVWLSATLGLTVEKVTGGSHTVVLQQLLQDVLCGMTGFVKQGKVKE